MMTIKELSCDSSSSKRRKTNRNEILQKKKANDEAIKSASAEKDPLSSFPSLRLYCRDGLSVYLKPGRGDKLSSSIKKYIQSLLKVNMEGLYGAEWRSEEKVKHREMVAPEARYVFVYEAPTSDPPDPPINSHVKVTSDDCLVGFVHYRFIMEEEVPVLYVYELQIESRVRGKGLGNFLMQLVELIAQKNRMGAVLLTVQKGNLGAINLYLSKLRYIVSTTSPSRVNPVIGVSKKYEILCKTFNHEAKAIFEIALD